MISPDTDGDDDGYDSYDVHSEQRDCVLEYVYLLLLCRGGSSSRGKSPNPNPVWQQEGCLM